MTIAIETRAISLGVVDGRLGISKSIEQFNSILQDLMDKGHTPLILEAKQRFLEVLGEVNTDLNKKGDHLSDEAMIEYRLRRSIRNPSVFGEEGPLPFAGDLFLSDSGKNILYLALFFTASSAQKPREIQRELVIGAGYIGEEDRSDCFDGFIKSINEILSAKGISTEWFQSQLSNPHFLELINSENKIFTPATIVSESDFKLAQQLEDPFTRNIALIVKRSGGILATDVFKKVNADQGRVQNVIDQLTMADLLSKEYVVICRKSSNQTNRVKSLDDLDKIAKMGLLCSCGKSIAEERVEELFVPTAKLQQMLDKSYWLTAKLVEEIKKLNITPDRILFNLQEGSDEIDAFVDLDGNLLMFELKDNQFSMGHAYPFGGRIGLYSPDFAIIVSTDQIEPQVKDYFTRVKPGAEIVYIDNLDQLSPELNQITSRIRSLRAAQLLSMFDSMASLDVSISKIFSKKIGIDVKKLKSYGRRREI